MYTWFSYCYHRTWIFGFPRCYYYMNLNGWKSRLVKIVFCSVWSSSSPVHIRWEVWAWESIVFSWWWYPNRKKIIEQMKMSWWRTELIVNKRPCHRFIIEQQMKYDCVCVIIDNSTTNSNNIISSQQCQQCKRSRCPSLSYDFNLQNW